MNRLLFVLMATLFILVSKPGSGQDIEVWNKKRLQKELRSQEELRVLNFWATWCKPCVEELPYFDALNKEGIEVVLVSLDFTDRIKGAVKPLMKKLNIEAQVVVLDAGNPNDWINMVNPEWSGAIPATVIQHQGINHFFEQEFSQTELKNTINRIIE